VETGGTESTVSLFIWLDISPDAVSMVDQLETSFGLSRAEQVSQPLEMHLPHQIGPLAEQVPHLSRIWQAPSRRYLSAE
jgi:hypothetical protein